MSRGKQFHPGSLVASNFTTRLPWRKEPGSFLGQTFLRGLISASRLEAEDSGAPAASGEYSSAGAGTFDYRKKLR